MPEGHTLFALARDLHEAFAGTRPTVTSPQGRFADGAAQVSGRELLAATSRGKHLFLEFSQERWVHVHLGLIGTFTLDAGPWTAEAPVVGQVRMRLAHGEHVADLRGPTQCAVVTPDEVAAVLSRLGPDPLRPDADPERAWHRLHRSGRTVAELLMDQAVVAGVGNVYRCEVLFRHRLSPFTPGRELRAASWRLLWEDLVRLMPLGVATGRIVTTEEQVRQVEAALGRGEPPRLAERTSAVYRRQGQPCPRCGSRVRSQVVAGRTLYWCGRCQRRR
ncbi:Fpg/Nei family DNA glycosylase [Phycicoccus endophyticus]|uniref:DNA-(apurinic or apyrimidinic site) lyase n=1 Tax=Phycicoccus endophyticus TaxID=1690220 RepID=A0A7G9R0S0_9MICO|nr:Fpg/Nei family DNA glycosylase [Phycicoccus endophyticus]NHI19482.1 Fpg/Nei family DNA glycosylase [Phycicoccus endophyticus]QNN49195.1 Fpg/Nei family DNA glycosylase [Phycicoccus endophyticus]GGL39522.1 formamidopyrimidine-DNA glycosylase [Phycicoccus endophyticus]